MANAEESGVQFLARLGAKVNIENLERNIFPQGIKRKDVISISGEEGSGKTQMLLHLIANCILPQEFGGLDTHVVFINTDSHFSIIRLSEVIESRIREAVEPKVFFNDDMNEPKSDSLNDSIEKKIDHHLKKLHIAYSSSSSQLLVTLVMLEEILSVKPEITTIILDSLTAFYWMDRLMCSDNFSFLNDIYEKIISKLIYLVKQCDLVLIVSTNTYMQKNNNESEIDKYKFSNDMVDKIMDKYLSYKIFLSKSVTHFSLNSHKFQLHCVEMSSKEKLLIPFQIGDAGLKFV